MWKKLLILNLIAITVTIVLSEDVKKEKLSEQSSVIFPDIEKDSSDIKKSGNNDIIEKPSPRSSKDIKFTSGFSNRYQRRNAKPIAENYDYDNYDDSFIGESDDSGIDFDYENVGRNEPIEPVMQNSYVRNNNRKINLKVGDNNKKTISDIPKIYTLRDGINMFRNFWRNRNPTKNEEVVPVITLTTSPTAPSTEPQQFSDDFGTVTGTATGTGTITAASADEIAQNNAASDQSLETPSPFHSFSRRQPIEYEILEEDVDSSNNQNLIPLNSDYIDIMGEEPEDNSKSSIPVLPSATQNELVQLKQLPQLQELPRRKNTKQPVKVLSELPNNVEIAKMESEPPKTGLDFYRQYLPNLRKLIEIRPKFFVNRFFSKNNKNKEDVQVEETQRTVQGQNTKRRNQVIAKRRIQQPVPEIVGIVDADEVTDKNRLPVKRVHLYLV